MDHGRKPGDLAEGRRDDLRPVEDREGLAHRLSHFEALFQNIPVMYFILDETGVVLSVNAHGAAELGFSPPELVGRPVQEVFHPDDRPAVSGLLAGCLAQLGESGHWELRKVCRDGSVIFVEETVRAITVPGGGVEILVACQDVTDRRIIQQRLEDERQKLKKLYSELALARQGERRRIAVGLHDQMGSLLLGLDCGLAELLASGDIPGQRGRVESLRALTREALHRVRTLSFELGTPTLYELGLAAALEELGQTIAHRSGARFRLENPQPEAELSDNQSVVLFTATRELLCNVEKHAEAENIAVKLKAGPSEIEVVVADDGIGFDVDATVSNAARTEGYGLFAILQQVGQLGGSLSLESSPRAGTSAKIVIPFETTDSQVGSDKAGS